MADARTLRPLARQAGVDLIASFLLHAAKPRIEIFQQEYLIAWGSNGPELRLLIFVDLVVIQLSDFHDLLMRDGWDARSRNECMPFHHDVMFRCIDMVAVEAEITRKASQDAFRRALTAYCPRPPLAREIFAARLEEWTRDNRGGITAPDREMTQRIVEAVLEHVYPAAGDP